MSRTQWHHRGDTRSADILGYTAIIRDLGGKGYRAHIEGPDGSTLCDWPDAFPSLEQAEEWARFCAVDMEQAASADPARARLLATLDLCRAALGEQAHPAHIQWIARIRRWVIDHAKTP